MFFASLLRTCRKTAFLLYCYTGILNISIAVFYVFFCYFRWIHTLYLSRKKSLSAKKNTQKKENKKCYPQKLPFLSDWLFLFFLRYTKIQCQNAYPQNDDDTFLSLCILFPAMHGIPKGALGHTDQEKERSDNAKLKTYTV